jgi:hypothetical protein
VLQFALYLEKFEGFGPYFRACSSFCSSSTNSSLLAVLVKARVFPPAPWPLARSPPPPAAAPRLSRTQQHHLAQGPARPLSARRAATTRRQASGRRLHRRQLTAPPRPQIAPRPPAHLAAHRTQLPALLLTFARSCAGPPPIRPHAPSAQSSTPELHQRPHARTSTSDTTQSSARLRPRWSTSPATAAPPRLSPRSPLGPRPTSTR